MKPITTSMSEVKTFQVTSGALRVTDPCYDLSTWCSGQLENVKNGNWHAKVGYYKDSFDEEMLDRYYDGKRSEYERVNETLMASLDKLEVIDAEKAKEWRSLYKEFLQEDLARVEAQRAEAKKRPGRVSVIGIVHESALAVDLGKANWQHVAGLDVGVDSGQAGFFDLAAYTEAYSESDKQKAFYRQVCDLTLSDEHWGILPFGAVSSSGYGDGGYNCYVLREAAEFPAQGQIVAACIVFIDQCDEDESDGEDEAEEQTACSSPS